MIFQMWNGAWNKLQFKVCWVTQAYLDEHSTLDPVMVSVVSSVAKPLDVNWGLKCKCDLIVKNSNGWYCNILCNSPEAKISQNPNALSQVDTVSPNSRQVKSLDRSFLSKRVGKKQTRPFAVFFLRWGNILSHASRDGPYEKGIILVCNLSKNFHLK